MAKIKPRNYQIEKAAADGSSGIRDTIRRDHMDQLKRELDRKLVGTVGYYDGWDWTEV